MVNKKHRLERLERAAKPKEETIILVWMSWSETDVRCSNTGEVLSLAQFDERYPDAIHVRVKDGKDDDKLG